MSTKTRILSMTFPAIGANRFMAYVLLATSWLSGVGFGTESGGLIGGSVEKSETFAETLVREVKEESNMKVLSAVPIGYQKITTADGKPFFQLRYRALVEPIGEFVKDPDANSDSGIAEIKLIDPEKYKEYFDWGEIGDRIIKRGIELKARF